MATGIRPLLLKPRVILLILAVLFAPLLLVSCDDDQQGQPSDYAGLPSAEADASPGAGSDSVAGASKESSNDALAGTIIFFLSTKEDNNSPTIVTTWSVSPNGGDPQRIVNNTGNPAKSTNFNLSPDCSQLLFLKLPASRTAPTSGPIPLMIMNTDGSGQVQVLNSLPDYSKWLPDGKSIVYGELIREGGTGGLPMKVTRADTTGAVMGSWTIPGHVQKMAMSPDGTKVAAMRLPDEAKRNIIYVMDLASGVMTELLPGMESDMKEPVWSPDSRKVAFVASDGQTAEIWVVDLQTGQPEVIWKTDPPGSAAGIPDGGLVWSPDGAALAFVLAPSAKMGEASSMQLTVVGSDGSNAHLVVEVPGWTDIMTWCNCAKIPTEIAAP